MNMLKQISIYALALAALSGCGTNVCGPAGCGGTDGGGGTYPPFNPEMPPPECKPVYTFSPPGTYDGDECIRLCYRKRNKCIEDQRLQKETCEHYNRMARLEFGRCIASGANNCYNSVQNNDCSPPDLEQCETEFHYCYKSCGGFIANSCDNVNNSNGQKPMY
ncbi:hypothetical protein VU06_03065 [Desulfobulbus sp. F3]|nr:hypothetical protein [Desulfobulbus sp. F3]